MSRAERRERAATKVADYQRQLSEELTRSRNSKGLRDDIMSRAVGDLIADHPQEKNLILRAAKEWAAKYNVTIYSMETKIND